jgi:hypothetical protein
MKNKVGNKVLPEIKNSILTTMSICAKKWALLIDSFAKAGLRTHHMSVVPVLTVMLSINQNYSMSKSYSIK